MFSMTCALSTQCVMKKDEEWVQPKRGLECGAESPGERKTEGRGSICLESLEGGTIPSISTSPQRGGIARLQGPASGLRIN